MFMKCFIVSIFQFHGMKPWPRLRSKSKVVVVMMMMVGRFRRGAVDTACGLFLLVLGWAGTD